MSTDGWVIGHSWAMCGECGAEAHAEGVMPLLVHAKGCKSLTEIREQSGYTTFVADVDKAAGSYIIETTDRKTST